jgi:choloylglycine hydrolase
MSASWASLVSGKPDATPPLAWTSRYASLTFNAFGRDFPDDGLNEAGLFIGEMTLAESVFPENAGKPRIFMSLWMQYVLDTCASVAEVVEAASAVALDGWGWHFLAADRTGAAASLEFLDGTLVVHSGKGMPVPVLCNNPYERELESLPDWRGKIAAAPELLEGKDIPRFAQAAVMLERYSASSKPAVDYAFEILGRLERGGTQWSLVFDLKTLRAWFRSARSAKVKSVELEAFRPGREDAPKFLDLHTDASGEVTGIFRDHTFDMGKTFAGQALAAILKISPGFDKMVAARGGTMEGLLERFAAFPERSRDDK